MTSGIERSDADSLVSLVVPTYNEDLFPSCLDRLVDHVRGIAGRRFEVIVVDDSPDEPRARLRTQVERRSGDVAVAFLDGPRLGKGAAVRRGVLSSCGSVIFTLDADLPVPLHNIEAFLAKIENDEADVVIGERPGNRYDDDPLRHVISRALYMLQTTAVFHRALFADTQCGFKAFRADALRDMARQQITDRGMCDLEYLYIATLRHLRVVSVPVEVCPEIRPTRIKVWRCMVVDPLDIVRFKLHGIVGYYG
jgi:glycosyltransferase involved in cell wall biosynthesis